MKKRNIFVSEVLSFCLDPIHDTLAISIPGSLIYFSLKCSKLLKKIKIQDRNKKTNFLNNAEQPTSSIR